MRRTRAARRRSSRAIARAEAARARGDTRDWAAERRARTRHLIELGGLVHKAGLVELVEDDRATLLGLLLQAAGQLRGNGDEPPEVLLARWRRQGLRYFAAERESAGVETAEAGSSGLPPPSPP
jgi:hypothetical protein